MFEALVFFGMLGIGKLFSIKENYEMKNYTLKKDENGNVRYLDRHCNEYVNNEKIKIVVDYDRHGGRHVYEMGTKTGNIYSDSYKNHLKRSREIDEMYERSAKLEGKSAYNKFDERFQRRVTTEIRTGKVIACLHCGDEFNPVTGEMKFVYRKYYFDDSIKFPKPNEYTRIAEDDMGIIINKKEYDNLHCDLGTYSTMPFNGKAKENYYKNMQNVADCYLVERLLKENRKKEK